VGIRPEKEGNGEQNGQFPQSGEVGGLQAREGDGPEEPKPGSEEGNGSEGEDKAAAATVTAR
jgi:hypothetical protein